VVNKIDGHYIRDLLRMEHFFRRKRSILWQKFYKTVRRTVLPSQDQIEDRGR